MARRRSHLRLPFVVYCGLAILVALAAMNEGHNLLIWVFGVMMAGLLISGLVSGPMMLRLDVRRVMPPHAVAGQPLVVRYVVRNRHRLLPAFNLHFEECPGSGGTSWDRLLPAAPAWVMHVGPRDSVHGESWFRPERRGAADFDAVRMWTTFPFGIIGKSITLSSPQRVLVFPRLYTLKRRVMSAIAPAGALGMRISPHAGAGDDYYGLREYRPGDSRRQIAWKRTANRDELVCIERTRPDPPRLRVVLDLAIPTAGLSVAAGEPVGARELEERAISLAATVLEAADARGYEIGLTILGTGRPPFPVRGSHWHRTRLLAELAAIDLDAPRSTRRPRTPALERAGVVAIHPDRVDPSVAPGEAWHFTARQLPHLVEEPLAAPAAGAGSRSSEAAA